LQFPFSPCFSSPLATLPHFWTSWLLPWKISKDPDTVFVLPFRLSPFPSSPFLRQTSFDGGCAQYDSSTFFRQNVSPFILVYCCVTAPFFILSPPHNSFFSFCLLTYRSPTGLFIPIPVDRFPATSLHHHPSPPPFLTICLQTFFVHGMSFAPLEGSLIDLLISHITPPLSHIHVIPPVHPTPLNAKPAFFPPSSLAPQEGSNPQRVYFTRGLYRTGTGSPSLHCSGSFNFSSPWNRMFPFRTNSAATKSVFPLNNSPVLESTLLPPPPPQVGYSHSPVLSSPFPPPAKRWIVDGRYQFELTVLTRDTPFPPLHPLR